MRSAREHTSWERAACLASLPGLEKVKALGFFPAEGWAFFSLDFLEARCGLWAWPSMVKGWLLSSWDGPSACPVFSCRTPKSQSQPQSRFSPIHGPAELQKFLGSAGLAISDSVIDKPCGVLMAGSPRPGMGLGRALSRNPPALIHLLLLERLFPFPFHFASFPSLFFFRGVQSLDATHHRRRIRKRCERPRRPRHGCPRRQAGCAQMGIPSPPSMILPSSGELVLVPPVTGASHPLSCRG